MADRFQNKLMQKFTLELLFQIIGIGSASGLIYKNNSLYIIGDNSGYLYEYEMISTETSTIQLFGNPSKNIPKKDKPDFETIADFENKLYIFGSGSTEKRNRMIEIETNNREVIATTDLTDLYLTMQSFGKIKPEDFNIEGAIYNGESWFLFNRGNGSAHKNVVFTIKGKNLTNEFNILSNEFKLPKIKGVRSSFTDAVLVENKIYFLATAEDTNSTYEDGEVLGSIIGRIDIETMKIDFTQKITSSQKFEGLTLYKNSVDKIEFLLCEDNDTDELTAGIYHLTIPKI